VQALDERGCAVFYKENLASLAWASKALAARSIRAWGARRSVAKNPAGLTTFCRTRKTSRTCRTTCSPGLIDPPTDGGLADASAVSRVRS